jgi:hypothetical protein
LFAGIVGTRRMLKLFETYNIVTWFIFGPLAGDISRGLRDGARRQPRDVAIHPPNHPESSGGLRGHIHRPALLLPRDVNVTWRQHRGVLDRSNRLLTAFCGCKLPRGNVFPWWVWNEESTELLLKYGTEYDHSMSHRDCQAYYPRKGDSWTKIDHAKKTESWMKPFVKGQETGLVEIPGSWYIDGALRCLLRWVQWAVVADACRSPADDVHQE